MLCCLSNLKLEANSIDVERTWMPSTSWCQFGCWLSGFAIYGLGGRRYCWRSSRTNGKQHQDNPDEHNYFCCVQFVTIRANFMIQEPRPQNLPLSGHWAHSLKTIIRILFASESKSHPSTPLSSFLYLTHKTCEHLVFVMISYCWSSFWNDSIFTTCYFRKAIVCCFKLIAKFL